MTLMQCLAVLLPTPKVQSKSSNLPLAELKKRLAAQQKLFDNKAFIGKLSDKGAKIQTKIGDLRSEITQREVDLAAADLAGLTMCV
ncbi:hypothetical protein SARC_14513 [Sphaeroforma arctica JP610]|uniref:Uncharacterized protein n=1 Tax=Sphaeroforma arctica JP610 TaxID=667725 RepID=A0A0L0F888_9EUKA|nr:hypothetical protein SARC_14513 [Sphaeroforma arctica JP610]KNC72927.1 hypothetical protein SARC_14513 [Sphaeroforma arctica JP610]|eukprot:XP_014146829.1 hypothetical protein SARC_14513 [Sphaeroforma arctica JP610]